MSAIATVLSAMGHDVTGSDIKWSPTFARLRTSGLPVTLGHDPANVAGAAAVAVSSAIPSSNVEVLEAGRLGIPVHSRADVLASITTLRRTVAVAGTHGKTTTSSMLALILVAAGMRPSFIIGGDLNDIGTNAVWDDGEWLVVEADESDGTFLRIQPELAVVTSVEPDHLEHYGSFAALRRSFSEFMAGAGSCVVAADDATALELAPPGAITFGQAEEARIRLGPITGGRSDASFSLFEDGEEIGRFVIAKPGEHNARNAAAAAVAARTIGVGRRGDPAGARPFRRCRRGASSSAGSATASSSSTTTPTCPPRPAPPSPRPREAASPASSASSSPTGTRASPGWLLTSRRRSPMPTSFSSPRSTTAARLPGPA